MSLLLSPFELNGLQLRNRVVMSPMCMHMAAEDGFVTPWHHVHYGARAQGQAALIFPETLAVDKDARIGEGDLGIWSDAHVEGLKGLVDLIHSFGAKIGAQIGHAGRNADLPGVLRRLVRKPRQKACPYAAEGVSAGPESNEARGLNSSLKPSQIR